MTKKSNFWPNATKMSENIAFCTFEIRALSGGVNLSKSKANFLVLVKVPLSFKKKRMDFLPGPGHLPPFLFTSLGSGFALCIVFHQQ